MFHLRTYASNILEHAEKIIFISPIYFNRLFSESYFKKKKKVLQSKSLIVPNGIDFFWSSNKVFTRNFHITEVFKLLYIGKFTKGKNVLRLVKAVEILNQKGIKIHLNLVGGDGSEFTKVMSYINGKSQFSYHGKIYKKEELKKIFLENDIFTMPSHTETFGLVYIEALSQGIPIVYTLNEGIYGFYDRTIGEAVDSYSVVSIVSGIEKICNNYSRYNFNPQEIVDNHNWAEIAKKYLSIYRESIK
ncbi:UDP-D-galactose:(glucosyl)lipopolysaccharide-1,6-D-galactosyltransferase [compost metagenome]